MNRKQFMKTLAAAGLLLVLPTLTPESIVYSSGHGWFKLDQSVFKTMTIKQLDRLCTELCGTPFKEFGFEGADFANNRITVQAFSKQRYNALMRYDNTMDTQAAAFNA